ncbi:hypothetical protein AA637_05170 [Cyanobacterium sp. HL-69]|nr:hypothetical protein AA637_05170 [Cyanobacterium sp. HL-69]
MKSLKINNISAKLFLFISGGSYLIFFSSLDISYPFIKSYIVLLPVQICLVLYFLLKNKNK